eukprot:1685715-Rhodomonas_salina.2
MAGAPMRRPWGCMADLSPGTVFLLQCRFASSITCTPHAPSSVSERLSAGDGSDVGVCALVRHSLHSVCGWMGVLMRGACDAVVLVGSEQDSQERARRSADGESAYDC